MRERKREREMPVCMHLITLSCHGDTSPLQLLLYLKEFSQKMSSKTHEIEKQVDTLVHEAKVSASRHSRLAALTLSTHHVI